MNRDERRKEKGEKEYIILLWSGDIFKILWCILNFGK